MSSKLAAVMGSVLIAGGLLTGLAAPASATGPCGSGYNRVGVYAIPESGTRVGTLEVYYNSSSGKNCALTYGYGSTAGTTTFKGVSIRLSGSYQGETEGGNYVYYAGPVYTSAPGKCIDVQGSVKNAKRWVGSVHCG
ncbi:spore-associated protein A [Nonomuraea sp. NPDC052116]|uniref:spore-associated protein A n=1 Tax=Nonomuraea sp. NPDC052116 TaxID=3155665 RepID=UPI003437FA81